MANKYELRRRALKEARGRSVSRQYGDGTQPQGYVAPLPMDRPLITAGICIGLVLLITALYVQTARHDFTVCDDNDYIYKNPMVIQGLNWNGVKWAWGDSHAGNWHPVTWMSHMLDYQLFGTWQPANQRYVDSWPGGHHLVSMAIHCANAVLLFLALRLMTGTLWPCVAVTALFAVHPLRVESVAWAAERKDVLCGLFWMASMVTYAIYARRRPLWRSSPPEAAGTLAMYSLVTLFFGLGLTAKSMAVTLPCVFLLLDAWPLGRWRKALWPPGHRAGGGPDLVSAAWLFVEKLPWFAMVLYDCQQTVVGQDKGVALNSLEAVPLGPRLLNALISVGAYLGQMFWPAGMAPFYPHPHMYPNGWNSSTYCQAMIGGIILLNVTGAVIWFWRKSYLAVGWFWFLGALMPVIGILQVGTQARADRYTYLPMIGVYLMVVWLLKEAADRWPQTRIALAAAAVLVFTLLSAITFKQVSYWINSYALFQHAVEVTDNNWFAYNHLGIQYNDDGIELLKTDPQAAQDKFDHSAEEFKKSIEIKPDYDFGHNNLGVYYAREGRSRNLGLAGTYFRQALRVNPRYADAFNNLALVLSEEGKLDEAIACHLAGLQVHNDRASDHNNLCRVYMKKGDLENAMMQNTISLQCDPNFLGAWRCRAEIYIQQNNFDEALKCAQRMIAIDAKSLEAVQTQLIVARTCLTMASKSLELHRPDDAIQVLSQFLKISDAVPEIYNARGRAYFQKGDLDHAREDFEHLVRISPQFPGAQANLSAIRAQLAGPRK
jgi:tetratricopeptide (TPR) repeat protein